MRLGGQYRRLLFLSAAYGMFRSASALDEIQIHMQCMMDRLTRLYCRVVDGQEQIWNTAKGHVGMDALNELTEPANEVRAD